jgi:5-methylcytosine-specific restriction endonuclease McrA
MKKIDRALIFNKYGGRCAYCGDALQHGWHADHIEPIIRNWTKGTCEKPENDIISNHNPSCPSCNIQKNNHTIEQFRDKIKQFVNSLNLYSNQYKIAKKYGLVTEANIDVKFYFETLDK